MEINNFSFCFPGAAEPVLSDLSLTLADGELAVLCGESGSGKTTLLRSLKEEIAPHGERRGKITEFRPEQLGFVFQHPDNQIVTDTVRHELAFGLENMGVPTATIRRRVAETAMFFGIDDWIDASVQEISGGQKQILNLAAVIAMRPRVLLLDEPISQLDPVARKNFLEVLVRINHELGITVLMSEHNLAEVLPLADSVHYLEQGRFLYQGDVNGFVSFALKERPAFARCLPYAARLAEALAPRLAAALTRYPLTVREGRELLARTGVSRTDRGGVRREAAGPAGNRAPEATALVQVKDLWFQYLRETPYVLHDLSMEIKRNCLHIILGGNGSGKTTFLSLLGKRFRPVRGRIKELNRKPALTTGYLTQNPKAMFSRDSVKEELRAAGCSDALARKLKLTGLQTQHPYDLSGGEQQRLALGLLLAKEPALLLLDEPTKGMDITAKEEIGRILQDYTRQGHTVVCVTHDVDFAAANADLCSLLFEGEVLVTEEPHIFFKDNVFYTTEENRIWG